MRYAVIMAGGSGTRLWPMSTKDQPKQLIPFIGGKSLLEVSMDRLEGLVPAERRIVCTSEQLRDPIKAAMPSMTDARIHGEPIGRDTLNAVGFSAAVLSKEDPDAVIATFTADHIIEPIELFQQRVNIGYEVAESNDSALVTFGIKPTHPATGYGYVELGEKLEGVDNAHHVVSFKEKPDHPTARRYVGSGRYLWNSGMFVWRAEALLECIRRYKPQSHQGLMLIREAWGTERQTEVLSEIYPTLPRISVDFAVMEPAAADEQVPVATVEMPVDWLDVGSWTSYANTCESDDAANAIGADKVIMIDSNNTLAASSDPDHLIATIGVKDLVIVHTPHATLVCHRDEEQRIKELHGKVSQTFGDKHV